MTRFTTRGQLVPLPIPTIYTSHKPAVRDEVPVRCPGSRLLNGSLLAILRATGVVRSVVGRSGTSVPSLPPTSLSPYPLLSRCGFSKYPPIHHLQVTRVTVVVSEPSERLSTVGGDTGESVSVPKGLSPGLAIRALSHNNNRSGRFAGIRSFVWESK